jgi:DNA ligase 1
VQFADKKGPRRGPFSFVASLLAVVTVLSAFAAEPPPLLLAERHRGGVDVSRYWVSEKFDGVRAYWDGRQLRFRSGNVVSAPSWFVDGLPARALDGELWLGRGTFDRLSAIVRRTPPDDAEWHQVRYMVFELPGEPGTFTERIVRMKQLAADGVPPWLTFVGQFRLADHDALRGKLAEVVRHGGEGLMLHRADAPYETGRSSVLLKVTPWLDAEARVVAHLPGKGRFAGMTGALRMEMRDGRRFSLGSGFSDEQRRNPPPVGALVTYRYRELNSNGIPRFARFVRVREEF